MSTEEENFAQATLKELQCPGCLEHCTTPIYQCSAGHNVCAACLRKDRPCALCNSPLTDTRNHFAERTSLRIRRPCAYRSAGCPATFLPSEMSAHVAGCEYAVGCQMRAWVDNQNVLCEWRGKRSDLRSHVERRHRQWAARGTPIKVGFTLRRFQPVFVSCHEELFWCFFAYDYKTSSQQAYVYHVGDRTKTTPLRFSYEVTLASEGEGCVIVNKGRVEGLEGGSADRCLKDQSGRNTLVCGKNMIQRFVVDNCLRCSVKIVDDNIPAKVINAKEKKVKNLISDPFSLVQ